MWYKCFVVHCFLFASVYSQNTDHNVNFLERVDCFPQPGATKERCEARECIWDNLTYAIPGVPPCYFPKTTGLFEISHTFEKEEWILIKEQYPKPPYNPLCPYGDDFELIKFSAKRYGSILNIRIEPKQPIIPRFEPDIKLLKPNQTSSERLLLVTNTGSTNETFTFQIVRESTKSVIWNTSLGGLMLADQYIQIATMLPTDKMYGFGENTHQTLKHDFSGYKTWSMFARDEPPDSTSENTKNLYGVHPFYMMLENDGRAHGVFILNSNAQEITTGPGPHLIYRTIGGILDIYFLPGPTPADVIEQYFSLIGKPSLPPYWALGFQLSRYGYKNLTHLKTVVDRNLNAGIPLEVVYADIDYMSRYMDFTVGREWEGFGDYVKELHNKGMKVILIFDPAIDVTSPAFADAISANVSFIEYPRDDLVQTEVNSLYNSTNGTKIMLSVVWPDHHTAFPDFFDPQNATKMWWIKEFKEFYQKIEYDGIWIDMNEPAAFGTNENHPWYFDNPDHPNITPLDCSSWSPVDSVYDKPPFQTSAVYRNGENALLSQKTLCMLGKTHRGKEIFYNSKNLYGLYEAILTHEAAEQVTNKRAAVISRSTFPSIGRYAGHWLGDNSATWSDLKTSVIGAVEFNMFGIPYIGSDVCGFNSPTTEELCLRWQQMGAFHTFFRNHNNNESPDQDPAVWKNVTSATKLANAFRYSYLSYLYSLHFEAALYGRTVIRPLFFEFFNDSQTHNIWEQFMWGDSFMIAPVLTQGVLNLSIYLPPSAVWYSLRDSDYGKQAPEGWSSVSAKPTEVIPVFQKGGTIIPKQQPMMTTSLTRIQSLTLVIAATKQENGIKAHGTFYWDDGESIVKSFETHVYCTFTIAFYSSNAGSIVNLTSLCNGNVSVPSINRIEVFGYPYNPIENTVKVNNQITQATLTYDSGCRKLLITFANLIQLPSTMSTSWENSGTTPTSTMESTNWTTKPLTTSTITSSSSVRLPIGQELSFYFIILSILIIQRFLIQYY